MPSIIESAWDGNKSCIKGLGHTGWLRKRFPELYDHENGCSPTHLDENSFTDKNPSIDIQGHSTLAEALFYMD